MKHKEHYNDDYIFSLSQKILFVMPDFDEKAFCDSLIGRLDDKELFARFDYIVDAMQESMADDYSKNIQAFFNMLGPELERPEGLDFITFIFERINKTIYRRICYSPITAGASKRGDGRVNRMDN